jgi:predicted alpha/beta-hydrolase family hydrolase
MVSAMVDKPTDAAQTGTIVLGHGASTNMEHRSMQSRAEAFTKVGLNVVRFNFLYTELKKGPPDRMPKLVECFKAVADRARAELSPKRLFLGGHSMGGRAASHLAAEGYPCDGCILLSYPLHPAGQTQKLRSEHLASIPVPVLCLNGTRDELCLQEIMLPILPTLPNTWTMHWIEGANHSYHVQKKSGRTEEDVFEEIGTTARDWIASLGV